MYKRRDYQLLHANARDDASDSSSSSGSDADERERSNGVFMSDSEDEGQSVEGGAATSDEDTRTAKAKETKPSSFPELAEDGDSDSDVDDDEDERQEGSEGPEPSNPWAEAVDDTERLRSEVDDDELVIQVGKVFKCRLCPKVLCLNEDSMLAHLKSKKHARYLAQLAMGAARLLIDSDGEDLTEEAETHAERHARMLEMAAAKVASTDVAEKGGPPGKKRRQNSGRQRQRKRLKVKEESKIADEGKTTSSKTPKTPGKNDGSNSKQQKPNRRERRKGLVRTAPTSAEAGHTTA